MEADPIEVTRRIADLFDSLGIRYVLGGSMASMVHGVPRLTRDADFAATVRPEHIPGIVSALEADFYVDGEMIREAIQYRSSFNVLHLDTMFKVDVFVIGGSPWEEEQLAHAVSRRLSPEPDAPVVNVCSAEAIILQKLRWYRIGGGVSDKQWADILGVLNLQRGSLDREYLERWAGHLKVTDLLQKALMDAGYS